ncbi:MAG TPA: hypothetical protein DCY89_08105, partial [Gammaproteobacteria bacterium]|nr:hypothetical protein [Gammaproteobacteria bacterium]
GLLATRPHAVEALGRASHFVFDKTGTLTEGRPALASTHPHGDLDPAGALALAATLAQASEHPLSRALVAAAGGSARTAAEAVENVPGGGLTAALAGRRVVLGSPAFVQQSLGITLPADPCADGDTPVLLADANGPIATFGLRDRLRPGAPQLIQGLKARGCRVTMLTGDAAAPAQAVARRLGIDEVEAGLSPAGKLARLEAFTAGGATVAMVGDGVNDAPVLAAATVSVAMGQGTALARSAADAIFLGSDLERLLAARDTGRRALAIIRENLAWALVWNIGVLPAAAGGWLSAWLAALGMSGSSLLVVLNALRVSGSDRVRRLTAEPRTAQAVVPASPAIPAPDRDTRGQAAAGTQSLHEDVTSNFERRESPKAR